MIDEKQKKDIGIILICIVIIIIGLVVAWSSPDKNPQTNNIQTSSNEDTQNEYGSSLSECLQKADSWFTEATQTAKKVLREEKQGNSYQGFINENASSESEIMTSLQEEYVDYKKECNEHF